MNRLTPRRALAIRVGILLARRTPLGVDLRSLPVWRKLSRLERDAYDVERIHVEHRDDERRRSFSVWLIDGYQLRQLSAPAMSLAGLPDFAGRDAALALFASRYRYGGMVRTPRPIVLVAESGL